MLTALVVDDNADIRMLLIRALEMEGFTAIGAENGEVARRILSSGERPQIVLLDLMMPVMDGQQFLEWKNSTPEFAEIPVVIISALADVTLVGARAALKKPIDLNELFEVVERVCA